MSWTQKLAEEPWHYDFFWTLGRLEALNPDKPKLGDTTTRKQEYLDLGQVPFMGFANANIASFSPETKSTPSKLRVRFLGLTGPMGPLPLTTTEEALRWFSRRDDAFANFLDIFNNRFLQLFFRAHADVRPAAHMRQPKTDRFRDYVGSTIGIGGENWRDLDSLPDYQKLGFAGLIGPRVTSGSRVAHMISGIFDIDATVEEFIGSYLPVAVEEQTRLGMQFAGLGTGAMVGQRVLTVDTRFRLSLKVQSMREYQNFLPGGRWADRLVDALSNAVGFEYDWEVELVLPSDEVKPAQLGGFGQLGWTTWVREPEEESGGPDYVRTRFSPIKDDAETILH